MTLVHTNYMKLEHLISVKIDWLLILFKFYNVHNQLLKSKIDCFGKNKLKCIVWIHEAYSFFLSHAFP